MSTEYIQVRRNAVGSIPSLRVGEPFWATDTYDLYVGSAAGNKLVGGAGHLHGPLTEHYIPYCHGSTTTLVDSPIYTDGTKILIGDTANAKNTSGLTINQGASDDECLALKSSDVGHSVTDNFEADTYAAFYKTAALTGGLTITGVTDATAEGALTLRGIIGAADPTDTHGAVILTGAKLATNTYGALGAAETVLKVQNYTTDLVTVLGSGNVGFNTTDIEAWAGGYNAIEFSGQSAIRHGVGGNFYFISNAYNDGAWKRKNAGLATDYYQSVSGGHYFRVAPTGAANSEITGVAGWITALTIGPTGGVCVGGTTDPGDNNLRVDGTLHVDGAATLASLVCEGLADLSGAAAGQIKFPAAQNASADVNTLDDYEEGTFTPAIAFGGNAVDVTYSAAYTLARYTKIGNIVNVTGQLTLTNKGSSNGNATITGLPFTVYNDVSCRAPAALRLSNITFANQYQGNANPNTTTITLEEITEAGAMTTLTDADFANNSSVQFNVTYKVA